MAACASIKTETKRCFRHRFASVSMLAHAAMFTGMHVFRDCLQQTLRSRSHHGPGRAWSRRFPARSVCVSRSGQTVFAGLGNALGKGEYNSIMGVEFQSISDGDGTTFPKQGQTVVVHYTGTLPDGRKFDSSRDRGAVFKFKLGTGEVLKGWDEGIRMMSLGQRAQITCPPDYAYGKKGYPGVIPPNATLVFDIELLQLE